VFRSGPLTRARLTAILAKVEKHPHNLRAVAKACAIYPADLMAWYVAGQDPDCKNRLMSELAWRIGEIRFERAARNLERIEAAANGGTKRKVVTKPTADGAGETEEVTVEDVLPAAWAIEKLEEMQAASHWEISPNAEQADELHRMMAELAPTPLLPAAPDELGAPAAHCFDLPEGGEVEPCSPGALANDDPPLSVPTPPPQIGKVDS